MASLKDNDTGSRMKHNTRAGFKRDVPADRKFGTPEEIGDRVGGTLGTLPDNMPSNFRQLGPDGTGGNAGDAKPRSYRGDIKFGGNPRRYT